MRMLGHTICAAMLMLALFAGATTAATAQTSSAEAQPTTIPDTASGRRLSAYLEAFNSGDTARLTTFLAEAWPTVPAIFLTQEQRETGGYNLLRIEDSAETRIMALIEPRDWPGIAQRLTLTVEAAPPHRVNGSYLQRMPPITPIARLSEAEVIALFREKLEAASAAGNFEGAVMLARNGRPIFSFASGEADRERGAPNRLNTRFRIGSMNKMFTAVSILQLVEAGRVNLDAPIGTYLRDYPNQDLAQRVTVRHLLTHTGGTGDIFTPEFFARRLEVREHADYLALLGARGVDFEPGARYRYSNYGFVLLGAIIEAVTGESYFDYVREHVYEPAGMHDTGSLPEDVRVPRRSVGYTRQPQPPAPGSPPQAPTAEEHPNADWLPYRGTSAGGGYATVRDLIRFGEALRTNVLLRPETLTMATTAQMIEPDYGHGFMVGDANGARHFGHAGGAPGMRAELAVFPESGYELAYATNTDTGIVLRFLPFVGARLPLE